MIFNYLSEKVVSAACLYFVDDAKERLLQQMLIEERKQNMTFNYNSYFSNAPIPCSVSKTNISFSCAMLPTDCKDLRSQFHGCLTLIQCTKVRIGINPSILRQRRVWKSEHIHCFPHLLSIIVEICLNQASCKFFKVFVYVNC